MEMENNLNISKYIVYITTNTVNNKIYVGVHKTNTPYKFDNYLGCGVATNRPSTYNKAKTPFQFAVKKYGPKKFIRKTLLVLDTLEEALKWEELIVTEDFIKREDTYNVAVGGGKPADTRIEIYQYALDGTFIKCWNSSVDAAEYLNGASNLIRNCIITKNTAYGYFWTNTFSERLNTSEYKLPSAHDKLYKFDKSGNIVSEYNSVAEAAKEANSSSRLILRAISGKTRSKGFYYSYDKTFSICNSTYNKLTAVYLYNLDGSFYKEFDSPKECVLYFNGKKTSELYSAVRTGGLYKGFQVSKEKLPFMKCVKKTNVAKKVGQYDLSGTLIREWESIEAAFKEYGPGVKKCLKGIMNKTKGYVFKYID